MALNSLDVQNKTFSQKMRGYDRQEVDEFLEIVIKDYDEMTQKIKDQERDIKSMQERLNDFDNMKDSLNRSIIVAQETADNVKAQAESNAERISREATQRGDQILGATHREAREILRNTYDEARRLVNESDELKRGMRNYYQRVTMLIEGQLANIKSSDWEEILKPSPIYVGDTEEKLREIIEHTNQNFMPINENGEEIQREGETAPETLDSFTSALNSAPKPTETAKLMPQFLSESVETKVVPQPEAFQARVASHLETANETANEASNEASEISETVTAENTKKTEEPIVNLGSNISFTTNND